MKVSRSTVVCSIAAIAFVLALVTGCATDANVSSQQLSQAADEFKITRRVVFYNGITGEYMLVIEGKCSIEVDGLDSQLELTCKTGDNQFKKHFLGLSDNVTYFAEQVDAADVSVYHYRVIFKPSVILPDIEVK